MSRENEIPDGLSDDDADECLEQIAGVCGVQLTRAQLRGVLGARLIAEISEWGMDDTEVGIGVANAVSVHLTGQMWPVGDDSNHYAHLSHLRVEAEKLGYTLVDLPSGAAASVPADRPIGSNAQPPFQHVVIAGGGDQPSLLERLAPDERQALFLWSRAQVPVPGGTIDLMEWPGWVDVMRRVMSASSAAWNSAGDVINRIKLDSSK